MDQLNVITNFFNEPLFVQAQKYSEELLTKRDPLFFTSHYNWHPDVVHESPPVLVHTLNYKSSLYERIVSEIDVKYNKRISLGNILFYFWSVGCYIPWHTDGSAAFTIYLNDRWSINDGGLFVCNSKDKLEAFVPQRNAAVYHSGGVGHMTTPVNSRGKMRRTIQIWLEK